MEVNDYEQNLTKADVNSMDDRKVRDGAKIGNLVDAEWKADMAVEVMVEKSQEEEEEEEVMVD